MSLKGVDQFINKIEIRLSEVLLVFIIVFVFCAALLRSFGHPLVWSVDLAQLLFVWICFLGADIALQNNKHIGVDLLVRKLPPTVRKVLLLATYPLLIAFLSLIAGYGTHLAIINYRRQFSGMEFSFSWATSSAPVGCLLMIRTLIKKIVGLFRTPEPGRPPLSVRTPVNPAQADDNLQEDAG